MMYGDKVMEHFRNPHNFGELKDADAVGKVGNPTCGDLMWIYIKVGKNEKGEEIISDITFKTFGCVAAIANSSILTDMVKGWTLEKAEKVSKEDLLKEMDGVPPIKIHCSILAADGVKAAIKEYREKKRKE